MITFTCSVCDQPYKTKESPLNTTVYGYCSDACVESSRRWAILPRKNRPSLKQFHEDRILALRDTLKPPPGS